MYFCDLTPSAWNKPRTSVWQVGQMSNKVGCALIEYWTPFVRFPLLNSRFIQNIWIRSQYWAELLLCPSLKGHFFRTVSEQESAFHKSTSPASWPAGACYLYSLVLWQKFFGTSGLSDFLFTRVAFKLWMIKHFSSWKLPWCSFLVVLPLSRPILKREHCWKLKPASEYKKKTWREWRSRSKESFKHASHAPNRLRQSFKMVRDQLSHR